MKNMQKVRMRMGLLCLAALLAFATAGWGETYSATTAGTHAIALTSGSATYASPTVTKTGDASGQSDDYDWQGTNAAVWAGGGGTLTITGGTIDSSAKYGNAVFSYGGNLNGNNSGDGTTVDISGTTITTSSNNSGGIMTTGGGVMNASNLTITTSGGSSAAIRSDKGGGTITVNGGTYTTSGTGSPAIYSTAAITVSDATLESKASEGVVIEGKNSVTLKNSTLTASNTSLNGKSTTYKAVMLYQSQSGDASSGTSAFTMTGGKLINSKGDIFYVTNNSATITLTGATITNNDSTGAFLRAEAAVWGKSGSNGGDVTLTVSGDISGDMIVDSVSSLTLTLKSGSTFSGAITSGSSSSASSASLAASTRTVTVTLEEGATWNMTGASTITSLTNNGTLNKNGYTLEATNTSGNGTENSGSGSSSDSGSSNNGSTDNGSSSTPTSSKSSGGGCDAGCGSLALAALSAICVLKKRN